MSVDRRTLIVGAATWAASGTAALAAPGPTASATASASVAPSAAAAAASGMPAERVLGIGGLFFQSADPQALALWYRAHLGVDPVPAEYGREAWHQTAGPTAFAPMDGTFGAKKRQWMVNFRVRSLDAMVAQLQAAGIVVKTDPQTYPNGRFARLHDPEGNPVELWEPATA